MESKSLRPGCVTECPACPHRHLPAEASLRQKSEWLTKTLSAYADRLEPLRTVEGEARWGYRERTCLRAEWQEGRWNLGVQVRRGRDKILIPIPGCPVHSARVREVLKYFSEILPGPQEVPLAYVVVAGKLVTLVVKCAKIPNIPALSESTLQGLGVDGVFLNLNPSTGNRIFASRAWHLIFGKARTLDDNGLEYGAGGFQQLLPSLYRDALDETTAFFSLGAGDTVLDFYSGTGTSLSRWQKQGAGTRGVELSGEAVECAEVNVGKGVCLRGRSSERIPQLRVWLSERPKETGKIHIFSNPPRTGFEVEVLTWLCEEVKPASIAYLSCSAGTLRRDLEMLTDSGMKVERLIPYDFFPQTRHVEVLALLSR